MSADRISPERREAIRQQTSVIAARSLMMREEAKQSMFDERIKRDERVFYILFSHLLFSHS